MLRLLKSILRFLSTRLFTGVLMLAVQLSIIIIGVNYLSGRFFHVYALFYLFSLIAMLFVVNNRENAGYKITWIVFILIFPVVGWLFYVLIGNKRMPAKLQRRIDATLEDTRAHMPDNTRCIDRLQSLGAPYATQARYVCETAGYPVWPGGASEYFPVGEAMFDAMLRELRGAERFVFLEYFIIRPGKMWDAVFSLLEQKVREGVEVRLMYDGLGSINTLPKKYDRQIRDAGIQLCVFNPFRPRVSVILNNRDHRKLLIVDGKIAFCGGINLADEYINCVDRFGHWKDTGVMLRGEAVWPLTFMFLQQWRFSANRDIRIDFARYRPQADTAVSLDCAGGFVQPFGDSPLDSFNVTENTYMSIIVRATRYVYITTPYLVIDGEMETALCMAAQSGVDVRVITPHRYDKWYVHLLTRSHYARLIQAGVCIYEYTPGFMHGKMIIADDEICMVGTCNMDFRSFYLHFECGVLFYHAAIADEVKQDMLQCQRISHLVTLEEARRAPWYLRMLRAVLKLFAPLM